jgi:spore coat polysaccharide biosynthesis protein SpsF
MGSTRLPGKTLIDICGEPLLARFIERVRHARRLDSYCVATTTNPLDDRVVEVCAALDVASYRGSEEDVLDRFYRCAKAMHAEVVVRLTADDPFKDPEVIDQVVGELLAGGFDYVSNTLEPSFPEGLDVEAFTFAALERAWAEARPPFEREHVTPHLWLNPGKFRLKNVTGVPNLSHLRWTLDTQEDLAFTRAVYERLYQRERLFLMKDILALLEQEPELQALNAHIERFSSHKRVSEQAKHETSR